MADVRIKYMQRIFPHLWFDTQAKEAAQFYTQIFPDSQIIHSSVLHNTPSGDTEIVSFSLAGYEFMAISAGPYFKLNPSVSFMLNFDPSRDQQAAEHLDSLWEKLSEEGSVLMPLQEYPFSKRYGWIQDQFGVSWQLILSDPDGEERPFIIPSFLFTQNVCGKAEEAVNFYLSVFKDTKLGTMARYPAEMEPDKEGTVMFSDFMLEGQWFAAMDSARSHEYTFNEAISFLVKCDSQAEIDEYWSKLSAVPEAEQCGWLKDAYGFSWQIAPRAMDTMMTEGTPEQIERVTQAFLKMKKFDIAQLQQAYDGK